MRTLTVTTDESITAVDVAAFLAVSGATAAKVHVDQGRIVLTGTLASPVEEPAPLTPDPPPPAPHPAAKKAPAKKAPTKKAAVKKPTGEEADRGRHDGHPCPECGQVFDLPQGLGRHRSAKHGVVGLSPTAQKERAAKTSSQVEAPAPTEEPAPAENPPPAKAPRPKPGSLVKCKHCWRQFALIEDLTKHQATHQRAAEA